MTITNLNTVPTIPVGTKLSAIQGRVLEVYEYKSSVNSRGKWSFQGIKLEDTSGAMMVKLKDLDVMDPQLQGSWILFIASDADHRPEGITVDEYKGEIRVLIDHRATMEIREGMTDRRRTAPQTANRQAEQTRSYSHPPTSREQSFPVREQSAQIGPSPDDKPEFILLRALIAYVRTFEAALEVQQQVLDRTGYGIEDEDLFSIACSLWIHLEKRGQLQHFPYKLPPAKRRANDRTTPDPSQQVEPADRPTPDPTHKSDEDDVGF